MLNRDFKFTSAKGGSAIGVRVVTRTTNTELVGMQDDGTIKVRLKAAAAGSDEANKELVDFLAKQLGVEANKLEIVAGVDNRDKILSVEGMSADQVELKLGLK